MNVAGVYQVQKGWMVRPEGAGQGFYQWAVMYRGLTFDVAETRVREMMRAAPDFDYRIVEAAMDSGVGPYDTACQIAANRAGEAACE